MKTYDSLAVHVVFALISPKGKAETELRKVSAVSVVLVACFVRWIPDFMIRQVGAV